MIGKSKTVSAARSRRLLFASIFSTVNFAAIAQTAQNLPIVPDDVHSFLTQRGTCENLARHRATDSSKAASVDASLKFLKCDEVAQNEVALRARYKNDANVLDALDHWSIIVQRLPVRIPVPALNGETR